MTFLLLSLTALAAAPFAGEIDAIEVSEESSPGWAEAASAPAAAPAPLAEEELVGIDDYASAWVLPERKALAAFLSQRFGGLAQPDRDHALVWLLDAQTTCDDALARLEAAPDFQGDRSMLHVLELGWMDAREMIDAQAVELVALSFSSEVRGGDLARVEQLVAAMDDRTFDVLSYTHASLVTFAEQYGGAVKPQFAPTRSVTHIGPEVQRNFAVRYHNMVIRRQRAMVRALNDFLQTPWVDPGSVEQARVAALDEIRAELAMARSMDAWADDPALRDALVAMGERLEAQLTGGYAELPDTFAKETLSPAEEARFEAVLAEGASATTAALADFSVAQDRFRERFVEPPKL